MDKKKKVRFTVDKQGNYIMEAVEGFAGEECVEKTQELEVAIGGVAVDSGKTDDYYRSPDDPIHINIDK